MKGRASQLGYFTIDNLFTLFCFHFHFTLNHYIKTAAAFAPGIYKRKQRLRDFPKSAAIVLDFFLTNSIDALIYRVDYSIY